MAKMKQNVEDLFAACEFIATLAFDAKGRILDQDAFQLAVAFRDFFEANDLLETYLEYTGE